MKKTACFISLAMLLSTAVASAELIASDSFSTGNGSDYTNKKNLGDFANMGVLTGTIGFSKSKIWKGSTGTIQPCNYAGLTHALEQGASLNGGLVIIPPASKDRAPIARRSHRELSEKSSGSSFYMSALVSMGGALKNLNANESAVVGLCAKVIQDQNVKSGIQSGIHLGLTKDNAGDVYLAAFAAGNTYKLGGALTAAQAGETQLVVLKLDMDTSGDNDTLMAWAAQQKDAGLTQVLNTDEIDVGQVGELRTVVVQALGGEDSSFTAGVWIDEFRFGTAWTDVTSAEMK